MYHKVNNVVTDDIYPTIPLAAKALLSVICRMTDGWNCASVATSAQEISRRYGIQKDVVLRNLERLKSREAISWCHLTRGEKNIGIYIANLHPASRVFKGKPSNVCHPNSHIRDWLKEAMSMAGLV